MNLRKEIERDIAQYEDGHLIDIPINKGQLIDSLVSLTGKAIDYCTPEHDYDLGDSAYLVRAEAIDHIESKKQELGL